MHIQALETH